MQIRKESIMSNIKNYNPNETEALDSREVAE